MGCFISVAKAAKLVGVTHRELKTVIDKGELAMVKGQIHIDDLVEKYPQVSTDDADMVSWVKKIKKTTNQHISDKPPSELSRDDLVTLAGRSAKEIAYLKDKLDSSTNLMREIKYSLTELKKDSPHPSRLQTMIDWIEKKYHD
jgi:hypothetical protein